MIKLKSTSLPVMLSLCISLMFSSSLGFGRAVVSLRVAAGGGAGADAARSALLGFDELVAQALDDFLVPGAAVGIVLNGDAVLAKGYGKRNLESGDPVTADTLFAIGSCTKAFTTFVLASIVDEGKLSWDDPVRKHLPDFQLSDEYASAHLTVRDLVSHRSGLPRHDLLWYNSDLSRRELVGRLRSLEPFADLRQKYHYQNLMYLTAGYLAERLLEVSWEDAVETQVLKPLGMRRTNFSVAVSQRDSDFAVPYVEKERKLKKVPFRPIDNMGPAGSINSSINEMLEWVKVHLEQHDQKLISQSSLREMHTPQIVMGGYPFEPEAFLTTYGLGWIIQSYRGHYNVQHGGAIDGFSALVSLFPLDGLGSDDPVFEDFKFEFRLNTRGEVDALVAAFDPEVESISFRKRADSRLFDPADSASDYVLPFGSNELFLKPKQC